MHHHYSDIRSLISEQPRWFDEHAVPRYCDFSPQENACIYADEVALVLIACQDCRREFKVCVSTSAFDRFQDPRAPKDAAGKTCDFGPTLADDIRSGVIHFGDPPNVHCCPAGPTMNCLDLKVLEYWRKPEGKLEWERASELEVLLPDDPGYQAPAG